MVKIHLSTQSFILITLQIFSLIATLSNDITKSLQCKGVDVT